MTTLSPDVEERLAARSLPDVLTLHSGERVTTPAQWEGRRAELLELFRAHVYGRAPVGRPDSLRFCVTDSDAQALGGAATRKRVAIGFGGPGGQGVINLALFVPNRRTRPAPAFLLLCHGGAAGTDPTLQAGSDFWPAERIIARGYAAAAFLGADLDPDEDDGFQNGVHGIFGPSPQADDAWGTLAAWAWGASRALDYLETDPDVDARRVALVGHSRGGKAALWAGAEDARFALVVGNESGCTGAALARGKRGERIADINTRFPHWFCRNYRAFNGREDALPLDQHALLALMAPRPVYVASAAEDGWADPESEFLAGVAASPVYGLFGQEGLPADTLPTLGTTLHGGQIGCHVRPGGHDLLWDDWRQFLDFADKALPSAL